MDNFLSPGGHLKGDPLGYPRNPLAVFLLLLAFISGLAQLVGETATKSVDDSLPWQLAATWAFILAFGSGITLIGMFWQGDIRTGLVMKKIGMLSVGVAATIYGIIVGLAVGLGGLFAAGTIVGFGFACFLQYRTINKRINEILHETRRERAS